MIETKIIIKQYLRRLAAIKCKIGIHLVTLEYYRESQDMLVFRSKRRCMCGKIKKEIYVNVKLVQTIITIEHAKENRVRIYNY